MRRVVITGIGLTTPLANGREESWKRLLQGQSGAEAIADDLPCRVVCRIPVPTGDDDAHLLDTMRLLDAPQRRRSSLVTQYALIAAEEALTDAGWRPRSDAEKRRTGVIIGSAFGGILDTIEAQQTFHTAGPRRISPLFIPKSLANMAAGNVAIAHGCMGPNMCAVTACAAGGHSIGDAGRLIAMDDADVMIAGGSEAPICSLILAGFSACRALSRGFNDRPEAASRPFDADRDGFVMGEGAGIVVLEAEDHAMRRNATIYGELAGYGMSADAFHITAPPADGAGVELAMRTALSRAGMEAEDMDYINAHGTSTPIGDEAEIRAIERIFGTVNSTVAVSSTKSAIGHLLGASGAVEAAFSLLAMRDDIIPPTRNLDSPIETPIDLVPHRAKHHPVQCAMSNSFGFGGTNSVLVFRKMQ